MNVKDKNEINTANSPNSSTDLFLNYSDLIVNKSTDDFLKDYEQNNNLVDININHFKNKDDKLSSVDRVKNEIDELNQIEIEQDVNINGQFEAELQELNLTHLSEIKNININQNNRNQGENVKQNHRSDGDLKVNSNIKNVVSKDNALEEIQIIKQKAKIDTNLNVLNEAITKNNLINNANTVPCKLTKNDIKNQTILKNSTLDKNINPNNLLNLNSIYANESFNADQAPINKANTFLRSNCEQKKIQSPNSLRNSKESDFDLNIILDMNKSNIVGNDSENPFKEQVKNMMSKDNLNCQVSDKLINNNR